MNFVKADISKFDMDGAGDADANIFGLNFTAEESNVILIPVPWEATTSYGRGAAQGPKTIRQASPQLDLFDAELGADAGLWRPWEYGIHLVDEDSHVKKWNRHASKLALELMALSEKEKAKKIHVESLNDVNNYSQKLNSWLFDQTQHWLNLGKIVGVVGGDHSVSYGSIRAAAEKFPGIGILHIDAHADLRHKYLGFHYSHASIMENVIREIPQVGKLVQVGIRDFCDSEFELATTHPKISTYFDFHLKQATHAGQSWFSVCEKIVAELPSTVYVSFDIDGLDPALCPGTGTPVPGGLQYAEALTLLRALLKANKKVVAFDLNEVAPSKNGDEWDGNVGARMLYKMCGLSLASNGAKSTLQSPVPNALEVESKVSEQPAPKENSKKPAPKKKLGA